MPKTETAGRKLRRLRESLGLTMHDVYAASKLVAGAKRSRRFLLPPGRLSVIESGKTVPSIYRLYTLAFAYNTRMRKLLVLYGAWWR
ncbi:MAG: hypothetical protein DMG70_10665 [Acidobacteria bacterium]|nr:MAG: hypothetical protein DMG70_10665 [Acidobacteriota bacterium]PYY04611.1 MAG: hypothetical protein DMG69_29845 [Acidobacteriota bacterium]